MSTTSESDLAWELDTDPLVREWDRARVEARPRRETRGIPLRATGPGGWRYRAVVREVGGRLAVAALSIRPPEGGLRGGMRTQDIRAPRTTDILAAAARADAMLRDESDRGIQGGIAGVEHLAKVGEIPADELPDAIKLVRENPPPPLHLLPSEAYGRIEQREARRLGSAPRQHRKGPDFYARLAIRYLGAARTSHSPNRVIAEDLLADRGGNVTADDVRDTGKLVAGWKSYATIEYGFLTKPGQGRGGGKPTTKLRRWVAEHPDDEMAKLFERLYPSRGRSKDEHQD